MSVSIVLTCDAENMVDDYSSDASAVAARISIPAHLTINAATGMRRVPLPYPGVPGKLWFSVHLSLIASSWRIYRVQDSINKDSVKIDFPGGSDGKVSTMRETWVQSLGGEDLLEKEMATHSSTLAWKIPWMEEPDRL